MSTLNIINSSVGDERPKTLEVQITPADTNGVSSQKETTYENSFWTEYFGAFQEDPHLKNAILQRAIWTWGKGWTASAETRVIMERWTGWGKDTAQDIFNNMEIIACVNGTSYAQIIWDDDVKRNFPLNLKPYYL